MEPFKYHLYLCVQKKPEGVPSCAAAGSGKVLEALRREISAASLQDQAQVTGCDCLGLCGRGPNLVVYPEGVWYQGVKEEDVAEIVREHLCQGRPLARLMAADPGRMKQEILEHREKSAAMKEVMAKASALPEEINQLTRGFMESRTMLSAIELDIFSAMGNGATARQVAERIGAHPRSTESLLNALAALGIIEKRNDRFYNSPAAARFLSAESPDDSRQALMHLVNLWNRWSTLTDAVKAGTAVHGEGPRDEKKTRNFIAAMHKNASFRAGLVVNAIDLARVRQAIDIGGGSGAYSIALARSAPEIKITVFDLPSVTPLTEKYVREAGLAEKIGVVSGDMSKDDFGEGYDLALLFAICHMWSPEENLGLFRRVHSALAPGGRLVIQDFVLDEDKTSPRFGAIFALNMLVNTRGGGAYSRSEYESWLRQAGFAETRFTPLPGPVDLVIGVK